MRRTVLALLAATAMVAGCQPSVEAPAADPAEATPAPAPAPEMPVDAPPQEEVDPAVVAAPAGSCLAEIGAEAATKLVERCVMVSPATHPPCNVANPCAMIQGEIDRACGQYGPDETRPSQCAA
ncbi:MAG: hypothetical protein KKG14_01030 [Alphaproteobacteria bacterium]|nr:hypothetical protein [Alphaproteobacteria bacterium]MBU2271519.1 hypothetical protein [Alphaproteobacteria bacterium]MBU2417273.1 hypothetical protein [Alphaproteobacteria bacterium]